MCADGHPSSTDDTEFLAPRDRLFALSESWCDHAQVAVDADEAIVPHQDFKTTWTLPMDTDHLAGRGRYD